MSETATTLEGWCLVYMHSDFDEELHAAALLNIEKAEATFQQWNHLYGKHRGNCCDPGGYSLTLQFIAFNKMKEFKADFEKANKDGCLACMAFGKFCDGKKNG